MLNLPVPDYDSLDLTSKLEIHVPENNELPLSGIIEIRDDTEIFLRKKKEAVKYANERQEKEYLKEMDNYNKELKKAEDNQLVVYDDISCEDYVPDGFLLDPPDSSSKDNCAIFGTYLTNNIVFDAGFRLVTTVPDALNQDAICYCPCNKMFSRLRHDQFNFPESVCVECDNKQYSPPALLQHLTTLIERGCEIHQFIYDYISRLYTHMWGPENKIHYAFLTKQDDIVEATKLHCISSNKNCVTNSCVLLSTKLMNDLKARGIKSCKKDSNTMVASGSSNSTQCKPNVIQEILQKAKQANIQTRDSSVIQKRTPSSFQTTPFTVTSKPTAIKVNNEKESKNGGITKSTETQEKHPNNNEKVKALSHRVHKDKVERQNILCQKHRESQHSDANHIHKSSKNSSKLCTEHNDCHSNSNRRFAMAKNDNMSVPRDLIPNTRNFGGRNHGRGGGTKTMTYGQQCHFTHRQMRPAQQNLSSYQHNLNQSWNARGDKRSYHEDNRVRHKSTINNNPRPHNLSPNFKNKLEESDCVLLTDKNTVEVPGQCEMFLKELPENKVKGIPLNSSNHFSDGQGRRWIMLEKEETSSNTQSLENVVIENVSPLASKSTSTSTSSKRKISHQSTDEYSNTSTKKSRIGTSKKKNDPDRKGRKKLEKKLTNLLKSKFLKEKLIPEVLRDNSFNFSLCDTDTQQICDNCKVVRCYPNQNNFDIENLKDSSIDEIVKNATVHNTIWHIIVPRNGNERYVININVLRRILPRGSNEKVASIALGGLIRISDDKNKDSLKPYFGSKKVQTIRPSDTLKFAELVSKYKLMNCILEPNYTFCIKDSTTQKLFNCTIVDCNTLNEEYTNRKDKDHIQWSINAVSFKEMSLSKMIVLSTKQLRDFVRKDAKKRTPTMKILDKADRCLTESSCYSNLKVTAVSSVKTKQKLILYRKPTTVFDDGPTRPAEGELCLPKDTEDLVESEYCSFCGGDTKNYRYNENAICRYSNSDDMSLQSSKTLRWLQNRVTDFGDLNPKRNVTNVSNIHFLQCSICNQKSCFSCVKKLREQMYNDNTHTNDTWYSDTSEILAGSIIPSSFVGHCCEIKERIKEASDRSQVSPTDEENSDNVLKAGLLHFPHLSIFIDSPMTDHVDVHGLGAEKCLNNEKPGLIHAVLHKDFIKPSSTPKCILIDSTEIFYNFKTIEGIQKRIVCQIDVFKIKELKNIKELSHKFPTEESISGSSLVKCETYVDVWIILGTVSEIAKNVHLVNMRWKSHLSHKWKKDLMKKTLYKDIMAELKHDGLELIRKGGSNGLPTYNNDGILQLLSKESTFPRKGKGVKLVQQGKLWKCYYLAARKEPYQISYSRKFTSYSYPQPKTGGQFEISKELLQKYNDVFVSMTEVKYNSALLCLEISKYLGVNIQSDAVNKSIQDIVTQKSYLKDFYQEEKNSKHTSKQRHNHLLRLLCLENKYSLVAYPVAYHYDKFDSGKASLENKTCFSFHSKNRNNCGRGGDGKGKFVFAILDWTNKPDKISSRRKIAMNEC